MTKDRLKQLDEKYKDRNILEELSYMCYYTKQNMTDDDLDFACWLYYAAYKKIVEVEKMLFDLFTDYREVIER